MKDFLARGLLEDQHVRVSWALTTQVANDAVRIHGLGPVSAHVLCRALTGGVLSSTLLDGDERYGIRWQYPGAVGNVFVDVSANADVRGTISSPVIAGNVDKVEDVYGNGGQMFVVKSNTKQRLSSGTTDAAFADVIGDLALFMCISDQVETAMRVVIRLSPNPEAPVTLCHGVMLQALPGCDLEQFAYLADGLRSPTLNSFLDHEQVADNTIERMLQALIGDEYDGSSLKLFDCPQPTYKCSCNREGTARALMAIPPEELKEMIAKDEEVAITCEFCRTRQVFEANDLKELLESTESK